MPGIPFVRRGWTTVRLMGGLGNQLFQYAAGRAVADRTRTRLRFDTSYFPVEPHRSYALGDFRIRAEAVEGEPKPPEFVLDRDAEDAYARERFGAAVVREDRREYDAAQLAAAGRDSFVAGYWQDERYFAPAERAVRRELRPRPTDFIEDQSRRIAAAPVSAAVHVRRGDFVSDPGTAREFGALEPAYYERAAAALLRERPGAEFFVFSDDPGWCAENLRLPAATSVFSGGAAFEDLALMAACDHAIIANSTFSWWGAWLGAAPGQLVIAPRRFFRSAQRERPELVPDRWMRV